MPVIVVGADTPLGAAAINALGGRAGEVRAFVTDPAVAERLRSAGVKTAIGDVSDDSHLEGAALGCFCAVVSPEAAFDERERSFTPGPEATLQSWSDALVAAKVQRVIWLTDSRAPAPDGGRFPEFALVETAGRSSEEVGVEVARLDDLADLDA